MARRQETVKLGIHCVLHVDHLWEQGQRERRFGLVGVDEWSLKRSSVLLVLDIGLNGVVPIQVDQDGRHLVLFGKAVDGSGDDVFLAVPVEQDLFTKTGVPKSGDDRTQVSRKNVLIHGDGSRHTNVVIRVAAKPDRLRHGAAGLLRHRFGHAGDEKSVLAVAGVWTMRLGAADRDDEQVILFQSGFDL